MKPSEPKCGSDHDYFVLRITETLELSFPNAKIRGFEFPIRNKHSYLGSADLIIEEEIEPTIIDSQGNKYTKEEVGLKANMKARKTIIIDFKPSLDKITDAVRQLKVYSSFMSSEGRSYGTFKQYYIKQDEYEIAICTYNDEITEERKTICKSLGVMLMSIPRKETKQKKLT